MKPQNELVSNVGVKQYIAFLKTGQKIKKAPGFVKKPGENLVAEAGLEPTTSGLWARRATNCSTPRYKNSGAGDRTRTGTVLLPEDFKSAVSTDFTTPATIGND